MGIVKKVKIESKHKGVSVVLRKGLHKTRRFLFYSMNFMVHAHILEDPLPMFLPELDLETNFLMHDKSELINWLKENKSKFYGIYIEKEIESAIDNKHYFFILKNKNDIIGYVKVGVGPTYIHDFRKTVVFENGKAFIYDYFILPEYRGEKLALFAINEVLKYFKVKGFKKIFGHIPTPNKSSARAIRKTNSHFVGSIRLIRIATVSFYLKNGNRPILSLDKFFASL